MEESRFTQEEWDALIAKYPRGMVVTGTVQSVHPFGVFVLVDQLPPDVPALLEIIHFGILNKDPLHRINSPEDYPQVGSRIDARILAWCLKPRDVRLTQLSHLEWLHSKWLKNHDSKEDETG